MEMIPVQSSQIAAIGHDAEENALYIQFRRSNDVYRYPQVTAIDFEKFRQADSIGVFFNTHFRHLPYSKRDAGAPDLKSQLNANPAEIVAPSVAAESVELRIVEAQPEIDKTAQQSGDLTEKAKTIVVANAQQQETANHMLLDIKSMRQQINQVFAPMKEAAHRAHRVICDQERALDEPLKEAELSVKKKIGQFVLEQQETSRQEEARQRALSREQAQRRAEQEAHEQALQAAIELEQAGQSSDAEAVLNFPAPVAPRYVAPAPVAPAVARTSGVTTRAVWKHRIVDESRIPREYLVVNEKAIAEVVKRTGGKVQIPGVEVYSEAIVTANVSRRA